MTFDSEEVIYVCPGFGYL